MSSNYALERTVSVTAATPRPGGITAICLALGWLGIGGLGNAFVIPGAFTTAVAPELLRVPVAVAAWALAASATLYAITALVAAIGLWRLRSWGRRAFLAWVAAGCGFMTLFLLLVRIPADTPPLLGLAFIFVLVFIFWGGWVYIRRVYARSSPSAL